MNKANFFWSGSPLQKRHIAAFNSFLQHDWDVTVWTYENELNVSRGIKVRNANELLDISRLGSFKYTNCSVNEVVFSDLFRLYVMKHTGGWWFDSDCFCLKNYSDFELLAYNRSFVTSWEGPEVNNAVLHFPEETLLNDFIAHIEATIQPEMPWAYIGPTAMTEYMKNANLSHCVLPSWTFYPIRWPDAYKGIKDEYFSYIRQMCKPSLVYHYYNSICQHHSSGNEYGGYVGHLIEKYS
jgi:hypothetical protein